MNSNRVKGTIDQVVGSVKRKAGELAGDTPLQIEGIAQLVKGKRENAMGNVKDIVSVTSHEARPRRITGN